MIYGFWLSMDWPMASQYEVLTLLEAYGGRINHYIRQGRLLIVDTNIDKQKIKHIIYRSASIKEGFQIIEYGEKTTFKELITDTVYKIVHKTNKIGISILKSMSQLYGDMDASLLAKKMADILLKNYKGKIELDNPDKRITFISSKKLNAIGIELVGKHKKKFSTRTPSKRPVFSPFSLHPKLARLMVNLSGAVEGDIIYDPFSGVGGIAIEAALMNIYCICSEIMYKWARGCYNNLVWIDNKYRYTDIICGDSLNKYIKNTKFIVTDPPYGRITSTGEYGEAQKVYEDFLDYVSNLENIKKIVFMHPSNFKIELERFSLEEIYSVVIPVHSGLTRVLRVVRRT
jgi:putative methyltransferase (TIGR01177 family)